MSEPDTEVITTLQTTQQPTTQASSSPLPPTSPQFIPYVNSSYFFMIIPGLLLFLLMLWCIWWMCCKKASDHCRYSSVSCCHQPPEGLDMCLPHDAACGQVPISSQVLTQANKHRLCPPLLGLDTAWALDDRLPHVSQGGSLWAVPAPGRKIPDPLRPGLPHTVKLLEDAGGLCCWEKKRVCRGGTVAERENDAVQKDANFRGSL